MNNIKIMNANRILIVLATMLALLATVLEAKSLEHRSMRHMREVSVKRNSDKNEDEPTLRHYTSKRYNHSDRRRRGFARWNIPQKDYHQFSRWQPSNTLQRPYFIPVYGPSGQIPIYFPPQPFPHNIGVPPDNPIPFMGPTYLPPKRTTATPPTTVNIPNRINIDDDYEDEKPIWGEIAPAQRPKAPAAPTRRPTIIPTRPPKPKSTTKSPPLVHQINGGKIPLNAIDESAEPSFVQDKIFWRPEDYKPFKGSRPTSSSLPPLRTTTIRPRTTSVPTSTTTTKEIAGPSNCVWAVISCCSATSTKVAEACFEQRGCPGPFWDRSPCDSDLAKSAIEKALEYYRD